MTVLSLFDGISCGMIALERAGIPVERYDAYEIDEVAIQISKNHYPQIYQHGDVSTADFTQYKGVDLILAGFPCQDLSINKSNREGLNGARSGLFWELVRAIREACPKYFLVENNYLMPKEDMDVISKELGVFPLMINSSMFSAQSRQRLYWTNIPISMFPVDLRMCVADILEEGAVKKKNLYSEVKWVSKDTTHIADRPIKIGIIGNGGQGERVYSIYGKSSNLTANGGGRGAKTGLYLIGDTVRQLTPLEAERLQTLPDNYTAGFKDSPRYHAIGNCWTVDVIAFLLSGINTN